MYISKHNRSIVAGALAVGLGLASGGAVADIEAIKVTQMPKQEVPGPYTIVDNRGAIVIENPGHEAGDAEVAETTVDGRVGNLRQPEGNK